MGHGDHSDLHNHDPKDYWDGEQQKYENGRRIRGQFETEMVFNHVPPEDQEDLIPRIGHGNMETLTAWIRRQIHKAVFPTIVVKFKLVEKGAKLPTKERPTDAGIDFYTNISWPVYINPGDGYTFTTGIRSEIPKGYAILLRDRSGLGSSLLGITAGVIDMEFRGEWKITIVNHGTYQREFLPGDKIAQGIITKVYDADIRDVDNHPRENGTLTPSNRGEKGFGSSGR